MDSKKWLITIFIFTILLRLILAFSSPNFTYDSYFHLRQVEHIRETGLPIYNDELSYGGRTFQFLPFFHYIMAFFTIFLPLELVAKLIPNFLLASLTIIVFLISKKITNNKTASLLSAFIVGLLPILYSTNSFSTESLFLPLAFLAIYAFLNLEKKRFQYLYIITFLLLSLTSSATLFLLIGFAIYLLLSFLENKKPARSESELMFFSLIFFIWMQFLFFKDFLIIEGIGFVWQNIPTQIIQNYFPNFSVIEAIIFVSVIPFLAGIFVVYRSLFQAKNYKAFLLISFVISTSILTWLRLIQFKVSLAFFGVILAILFSIFYEELFHFFSRTKISHLQRNVAIIVASILFLTMIFPAIAVSNNQEIPSNEDITAFKWLNQNIPENSKVAVILDEGHLLTYYGKRLNVMDDNFNLIDNVEERFVELNSIFTTPLQTHAVDLFDKYGITHIMFSNKAKERFEHTNFKFITVDCYERLYKEGAKIYEVKCSLIEEENE
jgi:hypothetical protein